MATKNGSASRTRMALRQLGKQRADNGAILVGAILEALVILRVPEHLGLSATELGHLGSLGIIIAGAIRSMWRAWRAAAPSDDNGDPA